MTLRRVCSSSRDSVGSRAMQRYRYSAVAASASGRPLRGAALPIPRRVDRQNGGTGSLVLNQGPVLDMKRLASADIANKSAISTAIPPDQTGIVAATTRSGESE